MILSPQRLQREAIATGFRPESMARYAQENSFLTAPALPTWTTLRKLKPGSWLWQLLIP